jgi:glycerol-3-phosphate dehydrogenase
MDAAALSPERFEHDLGELARAEFDVLVVGGGVVGAGAALDAVTRGLRVGVVEAQDWAAGTSSRSSKLIHGGLRYLQTYDFALVREALRERAIMLRTAPHLVHRLSFLYPLRRRVFERLYVGAGVLLYDLLSRTGRRGTALPFHRQLSRARTLALAPALRADALVGAVQYWDAQEDDARHTFMVLRTAASFGAVVATRVQVTGLVRDGARVVGVTARNNETGESFEIHAKVVVSATGAWTEKFEELAGTSRALRVQPAKGVHLVVPRSSIDLACALILPTEKSVLFVLPWGEHWLVGTTDTTWDFDVARPAASAQDVDYLLSTLNGFLAHPLSRDDVESVYVGIRPLIAGVGEETTKLSREHAVNRPLPGLVLISGGKYTTYRVMAQDVIDAALDHAGLPPRACVTATTPLVGAEGFAAFRAGREGVAGRSGLDVAQVDRLLGRYGTLTEELLQAGNDDATWLTPLKQAKGYLRAEVVYAVTHEGARHLDDVLSRRTRIAIETSDRGIGAAEEVSELMAKVLSWDELTVKREITAYREVVEAELVAESEPDDQRAEQRVNSVSPLLAMP